MRKDVHRLVFLDETGTTTKMTRLRGRARVGARLKAKAPFGHWGTQTFIAGLRCNGLTAPWVVDKPVNPRDLRSLYRDPARPHFGAGRHCHSGQSRQSQERKGASDPEGARGLVLVSSALQSRSQPDRDGIRQAQGSLEAHRRKNHRRPYGKPSAISVISIPQTNAGTISRPQDMRPIKGSML